MPSIKTSTKFNGPEEIRTIDLGKLAIYTKYKGHPLLDSQDHQSLLRYELQSAVEAGGVCASIAVGNTTTAVCALKPLAWDSQHFEMPMAKLTIAAAAWCNPGELIALLKNVLFHSSVHKPGLHVSSEVDIDDYLCLNSLLELGARVFDIKREYRCTNPARIRPPKLVSRVRPFRPDDKAAITQLLDKAGFESRFSRDPVFGSEKSEEMYRQWLKRLLDADPENGITLVMEKNGRVAACGTIERLSLAYAGIDLEFMGGGVYISSRLATGAYYPIMYSVIVEAAKRKMTCQTCVSLNNHSATKVLEKMNVGTTSTRYAMRLMI